MKKAAPCFDVMNLTPVLTPINIGQSVSQWHGGDMEQLLYQNNRDSPPPDASSKRSWRKPCKTASLHGNSNM